MDLNKFFEEVIHYTREHPNPKFKSATEKLGKLGEEFGEFCGATLIEDGRCPHKEMGEPSIGEGADIILCVLDVLSATYSNGTEQQIVASLMFALTEKLEKWKRINVS